MHLNSNQGGDKLVLIPPDDKEAGQTGDSPVATSTKPLLGDSADAHAFFAGAEEGEKSSAQESSTSKATKKRGWAKPDGHPSRPLSAYNLFFQLARERLIAGSDDWTISERDVAGIKRESKTDKPKRKHRKTHGKIGFKDLAKMIAVRWKELEPKTRTLFQRRAEIEKMIYTRQVEDFNQEQSRKLDRLQLAQHNAVAPMNISALLSCSTGHKSTGQRAASRTSLSNQFNPGHLTQNQFSPSPFNATQFNTSQFSITQPKPSQPSPSNSNPSQLPQEVSMPITCLPPQQPQIIYMDQMGNRLVPTTTNFVGQGVLPMPTNTGINRGLSYTLPNIGLIPRVFPSPLIQTTDGRGDYMEAAQKVYTMANATLPAGSVPTAAVSSEQQTETETCDPHAGMASPHYDLFDDDVPVHEDFLCTFEA